MILALEIRRSKILRIILANQMMTRLGVFQTVIWNPRGPIMVILWFVMAIPITGVITTMAEECGFFINLINSM